MGGHFHSLFIARHQGIEAVSGPKLIADCFQPFSELFSPSSPTAMPTSGPKSHPTPRSGLDRAVGETPLPFFGNHPFSGGFLR